MVECNVRLYRHKNLLDGAILNTHKIETYSLDKPLEIMTLQSELVDRAKVFHQFLVDDHLIELATNLDLMLWYLPLLICNMTFDLILERRL